MAAKEYLDYLMIYNNPNHQSIYFEGFEGQLEKYKNLINNQNIDDLYNFILSRTNKSIVEIKRDFSF